MGTTEHRSIHIVREHLAQPDAATGLAALHRAINQENATGRTVRALAAEVGGLPALAALHDRPWPHEPFDEGVLDQADRAFVAEVLAHVDAIGCLIDVEYHGIARRLLARVLRNDPKPVRRSSKPPRIAAGIVHAVLAGNDRIGRQAGQFRAGDIGPMFGTSSAGDVARALVVAAAFEKPDDDDDRWYRHRNPLRLPSVDLLHSDTRRLLLARRQATVELVEKEEARRAGRRPMVNLGDGRVAVRSSLADVAMVTKGLTSAGRIMVLLGLTPLVSEPELELFALSVPEARRLAALLADALAAPAPRPASQIGPFDERFDEIEYGHDPW